MNRSDGIGAPHDFSDTAAAYVLRALEPAEADAFRTHLAGCVLCQDDVDSLQSAVQALAMAAPQHPASAALRRRVLRAARAEPKPSPRRRLAAGVRWRGHWTFAAAAALAAAVVVVVVLMLLPGPSARVVQARVSGIAGTAQLRVAGERGELRVRHLSPPPLGHVYEVWLKHPRGAPVPAGVLFSVTSSGTVDVALPASMRGISQVLVTAEPDGGSRAPTRTPVIVARLS